MSEFLKKINVSSKVAYILCIIFGAVICIWPGTVLTIACRVAGAVVLAFGIYNIVEGARGQKQLTEVFRLTVGIILCVLGVWILIAPLMFLRLIPIVIGVVLLYHGIKNLWICSQMSQVSSQKWVPGMILAVIAIVFGAVMIFGAGFFLRLGMIFVGIALMYDGIYGLLTMHKAGGNFKGSARSEDPVDVDYKEL